MPFLFIACYGARMQLGDLLDMANLHDFNYLFVFVYARFLTGLPADSKQRENLHVDTVIFMAHHW